MTVKKAHLKYGIPKSRIRTAIHHGWIDAEMKSGRYVFSKKAFKKNFKSMSFHERTGRMFITTLVKEFRSVECNRHCFDTNAAADEFEKMKNK